MHRIASLAALLLLAGCSRERAGAATPGQAARDPSVTIRDEGAAVVRAWQAPAVSIAPEAADAVLGEARRALAAGRLHGGQRDAVPLLLALRALPAPPEGVDAALGAAMAALVARADAALSADDETSAGLQQAHAEAAVARAIDAEDARVLALLSRLDRADAALAQDLLGEQALAAGELGEAGGGALAHFRAALRLRPGDARARQGLAAVESSLIRRAEEAAAGDRYDEADRWLAHAATVRPGQPTTAAARARIEAVRALRIGQLRDRGLEALRHEGGLPEARRLLGDMLRIAPPGDPAASELRGQIDLVAHYGLFRPGQVFTDALRNGGRGPQMVVVRHGAFRMGAEEGEADAGKHEKPAHYVRFDRGFAMARTEVTVGEFRRFVAATGYEPRAVRRGHSIVYDERSGNFVRRSGVDWRSGYTGQPAGDDDPVLHVSARDAEAYAGWLSAQTGQRYRLPSEAEFEYALRAGTQGRMPWGEGPATAVAGNVTGQRDRSPGGRTWRNHFPGYGDRAWGPAPVGRYDTNAYGLHDLAGNVSEWVADCWHDGYRRAPSKGEAWINPGCRTRVMRGGAWSSAPAQTRAAWRLSLDADTTNARLGFRVVREL